MYVTSEEFDRYIRGALLAFVLLTVAIGYALTTKPDTSALRDGLVSACQRERIGHAQSNVTGLVSFKILSLSGQREFALGKGDKANAKLHKQSAELLFEEASRLRITGLTECSKAVDSARSYRYPVAGPVGDPKTGQPTIEAKQIIEDSRRLLAESEHDPRG